MRKLAVVALGGNALLRGNQRGTAEEQLDNVTATLENLIYLVKEGYDVIISHGNGPQVGNLLMQYDAGDEKYDIPQFPLDVAVSMTQGSVGYMIERSLRNILRKYNLKRDIITMVTQVVVDKNDKAFQNPTKRVGKIYAKEQADELSKANGWVFKEEVKAEGGWRRVVPSPMPKDVMNTESVEEMAREGKIVITVGGGGVPVYIDDDQNVQPTEAVIDKDAASAVLGEKVKADEFYILTDVPFVCINYNKPNEEQIEFLNYADTVKHMENGMFAEGSMAPKIKACLRFIEGGGAKSVITEATKLEDKSYGTKITMEYED